MLNNIELISVAANALYQDIGLDKDEAAAEGLRMYQASVCEEGTFTSSVLWIGQAYNEEGAVLAGGLFEEKYFGAAFLLLVAKEDDPAYEEPYRKSEMKSIEWKELVDLLYNTLEK